MKSKMIKTSLAIVLMVVPALAIAQDRDPFRDWVCSVAPGFCYLWNL